MAQRPRGTRDFAPDEMAARNGVAATIRDVFHRFGYREVQTPTFEELDLFTAKSGPGIVGELYDFKDKGERAMCLRPELTAPVMRMVFQDHAFDPKPIKWSYFGNCFRYDRPQAGRYREFWQFGCEQVGAGTPLAYAELIALADAIFDATGLGARDLAVGHVGLLRTLVDGLAIEGEERAQVMRLIDKRDVEALRDHLKAHDCPPAVQDTLFAAIGAATVDEAADILEPCRELDELRAVFAFLAEFGVEARLDLGVARGLDYYTGIVFEAHCKDLGAQSQLLGGGGYDLAAVFDAQPVPTMGFGLGFDRLLVALEAQGRQLPPAPAPLVYLGALGDEAQRLVVRTAAWLRSKGAGVDIDLLGRKPAQIAKAADAAGARYLAIVGDRDLEAGHIAVKSLATGDASDVDLSMLGDWLLENTGLIDLRDYN